jgi:hypothetical protein
MKSPIYCGTAHRNVNPYKEIIDRLPGWDDMFIDDLNIRVIVISDGKKNSCWLFMRAATTTYMSSSLKFMNASASPRNRR